MTELKLTNISVLNDLIKKDGIVEYIRDYYSAINGHLKILHSRRDFYIAEDMTYQPWLSVMGHIPNNINEQDLYNKLFQYAEKSKYIAVYTNIEQVAAFLLKMGIFSYHEDFVVALLSDYENIDERPIRLATIEDLPFIEKHIIGQGILSCLTELYKIRYGCWKKMNV